MAIPQHRPLTCSRVDENDRELIRRASHRLRRRHVDAVGDQTFARRRAEIVVSEASDVPCAPAKPRARRHRGGHLPAGQPRRALQPLLRAARGKLGNDGDEIDAIEAEPDHVERTRVTRWDGKGDAHQAANAIRTCQLGRFDFRLSFAYS